MVKERRDNRRVLKIGDKFNTNQNGDLIITGFADDGKYAVRFISTGYETTAYIDKIKLGKVKDKLKPRVYGKGYFGDGVYSCLTHPTLYSRWKKMLARCYSGNFPNYVGCEVCSQWLNFQTFANDCLSLPGFSNDLTGLDLDKDTLYKGNKIYSPDTCHFIPHSINFNYAVRQNEVY